MNIDWAPLKVPRERRLQTLSVGYHVYTMVLGQFASTILILLLLVSLDENHHIYVVEFVFGQLQKTTQFELCFIWLQF